MELSSMVAGHTRCLADGCFILLKQKFRRSDGVALEQLAAVVNNSFGSIVPQLLEGFGVVWLLWDTFCD